MKKVLLSKYFKIESTTQDDKINFELSGWEYADALPFLGRSSSNNGIVDYVSPISSKINQGKVITVALDGSTGATFYQHHKFCSGQNIWALIPKEKYFDRFNPKIALFIVTSIRKAVRNYSYNLSLTKTRLVKVKILLPVKENKKVDVDQIEKMMNKLRNISLLDDIPNNRHSHYSHS
jgi:hypothetical protein